MHSLKYRNYRSTFPITNRSRFGLSLQFLVPAPYAFLCGTKLSGHLVDLCDDVSDATRHAPVGVTSSPFVATPNVESPDPHRHASTAGGGDGRGPCAAPFMTPLPIGRGDISIESQFK